MTYDICFSIAGSDPSGGAGLQADLKTFAALGCYGAAAATAITVQDTRGVRSCVAVDARLVEEQVAVVMEDLRPKAVKIGMVGTAGNVSAIRAALSPYLRRRTDGLPFVVLDPILVSSSGRALLEEEAVGALMAELMPLCDLITPNRPELQALTKTADADEGAQMLAQTTGCRNILVKGGHCEGEPIDLLFADGRRYVLGGERIATRNTHGTGCTLSSAIAAYMARGCCLPEAAKKAKRYVTEALRAGRNIDIGGGKGPMNHFFNPEKLIIE